MNPDGTEAQLWYVVFTDAVYRGWWNFFTRPGFEHVWSFRAAEGQGIVAGVTVCDYNAMRHAAQFYPVNPESLAVELAVRGHTVLQISFQPRRKMFLRGLMYCVTLTKAHIGIRCLAITPYQLYRSLLRRGAIVIGGEK